MERASAAPIHRVVRTAALLVAAASALAGCRHLGESKAQESFAIAEPSERHPIIVTRDPTGLSLRVAEGLDGLTPRQRAQLFEFLASYRAGQGGAGKLRIAAPTAARNEAAVMSAVVEIREVMGELGLGATDVSITAYESARETAPAIRLTYDRHLVQAPECGRWPANLAEQPDNLSYHNFGCATQRNLAMQVANPADLVHPRTMTPASSERRHDVYGKYVTGKPTAATAETEQSAKTDGK